MIEQANPVGDFFRNHAAAIVVTVGLLLDIIGVSLVWRFGLPDSIDRSGMSMIGIGRPGDPHVIENKAKVKRYDWWSNTGMSLVIVGFILVSIGVWIPSKPQGLTTAKETDVIRGEVKELKTEMAALKGDLEAK